MARTLERADLYTLVARDGGRKPRESLGERSVGERKSIARGRAVRARHGERKIVDDEQGARASR